MIRAQVIRTDTKAEEFGAVAFTCEFAVSSQAQVIAYLEEKARGCGTVGEFRVDVVQPKAVSPGIQRLRAKAGLPPL